MKRSQTKSMAIAVASNKIGYVFMMDGEVKDWGLSSTAAKSPEAAVAKVKYWLDFYQPNLIVTEKLSPHTRKSGRTICNVNIIADMADKYDEHHIQVERVQTYPSKYDEIDDLAVRFSVLESWKPERRKPWQSEAKNTIIFEALALLVAE